MLFDPGYPNVSEEKGEHLKFKLRFCTSLKVTCYTFPSNFRQLAKLLYINTNVTIVLLKSGHASQQLMN